MKPFGFLATALAFGGAAVFLWAATWPFHALFVSITGVEPIIGWFALGGLIFATLILAVGGIAAVGVSTGVVMVFIVGIAESAQPAFLSLTPLGADRLWILLVWVPFWLLNILGRGIPVARRDPTATGARLRSTCMACQCGGLAGLPSCVWLGGDSPCDTDRVHSALDRRTGRMETCDARKTEDTWPAVVDRALWFGQRHEASGSSHLGAAPRTSS
jgi:hypothetical protein